MANSGVIEQLGQPHWTLPIQAGDTLARREVFRASGWIEPNWKNRTVKLLRVVERHWKRYCEHIGEEPLEYLQKCDAPNFMNWLDWMIRSSKRKTKATLDVYWRYLCGYYEFHFSVAIEHSVMRQMRRYIEGKMLKGQKVNQSARRKDTLSPEDSGILFKTLWVYDDTTRPHEHLRVQERFADLLAYISGSRPGVILAQDDMSKEVPSSQSSLEDGAMTPNGFSRSKSTSDLPDRTGLVEPQTICYRDIELFIIRNPGEGERDVIAAVVNFRNLKGRPEGADGTKFFLHCDYQLVYCPITFILAFAFADNAFKSELITPEYLLRAKVPSRLHTLPIHWKAEILDKPILRGLRRDSSGVEIDDWLPLSYRYDNDAIHRLGDLAGFRHSIKFYCFRRWTANTLNKNVTEQERNRTLGHGGSQVYLKHYHDDCVRFDIQSMVLLRPSQDRLIQAAAEMRRDRDPHAPRDLDYCHREEIRRNSYLRQLRTENRLLLNGIRDRHGKLASSKNIGLYKEYMQRKKEIDRIRKILDREMRQKVKDDYHNTMSTIEMDKQIEQMMRREEGFDQSEDDESTKDENESWNPPIPQHDPYQFARIDSAWRHVEVTHISLISSSTSLPCPHPARQSMEPFHEKNSLLSHIARIHHYCKDQYSLRRCSRKDYALLNCGKSDIEIRKSD
ncbi:MAG: hypothetical protein M1814_006460 [Vezdaea aestivalis]|nr:MAG: hypothetical protein M1814_006460 [Vezdaea aestivalis]